MNLDADCHISCLFLSIEDNIQFQQYINHLYSCNLIFINNIYFQMTCSRRIQIYQKVLTFKYSNSILCYKCQLWCRVRANKNMSSFPFVFCIVFCLVFCTHCILFCIVLDPIRTCAVFPPNIYKHTGNTKLLRDLHLIPQNNKPLLLKVKV